MTVTHTIGAWRRRRACDDNASRVGPVGPSSRTAVDPRPHRPPSTSENPQCIRWDHPSTDEYACGCIARIRSSRLVTTSGGVTTDECGSSFDLRLLRLRRHRPPAILQHASEWATSAMVDRISSARRGSDRTCAARPHSTWVSCESRRSHRNDRYCGTTRHDHRNPGPPWMSICRHPLARVCQESIHSLASTRTTRFNDLTNPTPPTCDEFTLTRSPCTHSHVVLMRRLHALLEVGRTNAPPLLAVHTKREVSPQTASKPPWHDTIRCRCTSQRRRAMSFSLCNSAS
jgi:hypothetical protein